jgi:uncharacterized protein (DUF433 family)
MSPRKGQRADGRRCCDFSAWMGHCGVRRVDASRHRRTGSNVILVAFRSRFGRVIYPKVASPSCRAGIDLVGIVPAKCLEERFRVFVGRHPESLRRQWRARRAPCVARPARIYCPSRSTMDEKALLERITYNPQIFGGKPIVRGHRLAVEHVLGMLAAGDTIETVVSGYPWMEREDVLACLAYARQVVGHERIEPSSFRPGREAPPRLLCLGRGAHAPSSGRPRRGLVRRVAGRPGRRGDSRPGPGRGSSPGHARQGLRGTRRGARTAACGHRRLVGLSAVQQAEVALRVLQLHGADLTSGAIVTAEAGRLRVRLSTGG